MKYIKRVYQYLSHIKNYVFHFACDLLFLFLQKFINHKKYISQHWHQNYSTYCCLKIPLCVVAAAKSKDHRQTANFQ